MLLEASRARRSVYGNATLILSALLIGAILFPNICVAEGKHQQEDAVLDDASLLRRRLEEVLKPEPKAEEAKDQEEDSVEIRSVPTSISLLALDIGKGLTPKKLNTAVERIKEAEDEVEMSQAARALAAMLGLDPDKFREKYEKENGELDFEKIFADLQLDEEGLDAQKEALKKAIEEESQGPVQDEEETTEEGDEGEDEDDLGPDDPSDPLAIFDDGSAFNPAEGGLPDQFLDDLLEEQDDLDDEEEIIDENAQNPNELDKNANKNNDENNKNQNKAKNPGNPKNPPPPESPPQFPPIGGGGGGGGGAKNPGIQPTKMPNPQPLPGFTPPTPVGEIPLGPDTVNALLGRDKNAAKDAARREDKIQQILNAYQNLNQTAIQNILQIGKRQSATIGVGPRSRTTTTSASQGGGFADRLRGFSSARGAPGQVGPVRATGGPGLGLPSSQGSVTAPPGYGAKSRQIRGRKLR